jgi:hypothetical protein
MRLSRRPRLRASILRWPRRSAIAACGLTAGLAGCSSTKYGVFALEARGTAAFGNIHDNQDTATVSGSATTGIYGDGLPDFHFRGRGVGLEAAIRTAYVDLIGGIQQRRVQDETIPETSIGLRKRFGSDYDASNLYVFALARQDLEGTEPDAGFNGTSIGAGLLSQIGHHWFLDFNLAWEKTGHLDIEPGHSRMEEAVFQAGVGYSF